MWDDIGKCYVVSLETFLRGMETELGRALIIDLSTNHVENYRCHKSKRNVRQIFYVYFYIGKRRCETS